MRQAVKMLTAGFVLIFVLFNATAAVQTKSEIREGFGKFVTAKDGKLYDDDGQLRFISFNIPCLHYSEDELAFMQTNPWTFPSSFEIEDALESVRQLGGKVVRIYTLSVASKDDKNRPYQTPKHILGAGEFNEQAFKVLDKVIATAEEKQIRLIIPLVDNWKWWGGVADYAAFSGKGKSAFWEDEKVIADFKKTIDFVLNRTNTLTGCKYKDEKTILAWETGNELQSPAYWTEEIAKYIKSIDSRHLLIDGLHSEIVRKNAIESEYIDLVTSHHYSPNYKHTLKQIRKNIANTKGKKPYFIGEFGFLEPNEFAAIMDCVIDDGAAGALLWSLRKHRQAGGFYCHSEPLGKDRHKAYHWPGFESGNYYNEKQVLNLIRQKAAKMNGTAVRPLPKPKPPVLLPIEDVSAISWQGAAGAEYYILQRTESIDEPNWIMVADKLSDAAVQYYPLHNDATVRPSGSYYYRICAVNESGKSEASNIVGPVKVEHRTLVDNCDNFNKLCFIPSNVKIDSSSARAFKEDMSRFKLKNSCVVYKLASDVIRIKVYCFFKDSGNSVEIAVSPDNKKYTVLKTKAAEYNSGSGDYNCRLAILCEAQTDKKNMRFVRITCKSKVQISRVEIQYAPE